MLVGCLGLLVVVFFFAIFPFFAVEDPKFSEFMLILSIGLPFSVYVLSIGRGWSRLRTLTLGIPAHAPWPVFLDAIGDQGQLLVVAIGVFALFFWYALSIRSVSSTGN